LLLGAIQMLMHIGQAEVAEKVHNAWLKTMEDGTHTYDIFKEDTSKLKVGTQEFADAVIANLGQKPQQLKHVDYSLAKNATFNIKITPTVPAKKELIGVDIFLHHKDRDPNKLGEAIKGFKAGNMELTMITNRGVKVYPDGMAETFCTDHWRCRFKSEELKSSTYADVIAIMQGITDAGFDIIKTENLVTLNGEAMFSAGQGQ